MTQIEATSHNDELMTIPAVARLFGVSRTAVHYWVQDGKLPARQFGRVWLVRCSDAEALRTARAAAA